MTYAFARRFGTPSKGVGDTVSIGWINSAKMAGAFLVGMAASSFLSYQLIMYAGSPSALKKQISDMNKKYQYGEKA